MISPLLPRRSMSWKNHPSRSQSLLLKPQLTSQSAPLASRGQIQFASVAGLRKAIDAVALGSAGFSSWTLRWNQSTTIQMTSPGFARVVAVLWARQSLEFHPGFIHQPSTPLDCNLLMASEHTSFALAKLSTATHGSNTFESTYWPLHLMKNSKWWMLMVAWLIPRWTRPSCTQWWNSDTWNAIEFYALFFLNCLLWWSRCCDVQFSFRFAHASEGEC